MNSITLFLDIDGVLHSTFEHEHLLNKIPDLYNVTKNYNVDIVISSTWKQKYSLNKLKEMLYPLNIKDKNQTLNIKSLTNSEWLKYIRHAECLYWLKNNSPYNKWIALDDRYDLFKPFTNELIITNHKTGLTNKELELLDIKLHTLSVN